MENKNIILHYFPLNARGCFIRAILKYGNVQYTENVIKFEDWPKIKPTMEFKSLPVLEIDNIQYSQTLSICIYLAKQLKLMGSTPEEEHSIISLFTTFDDYIPRVSPIIKPNSDEDKDNIDNNRKEFIEFTKGYLKVYEQRAINNGGKYMVGSSFSLADIVITLFYKLVFDHFLLREYLVNIFEEVAPTVNLVVQGVIKNELSSFFSGSTWYVDSLF